MAEGDKLKTTCGYNFIVTALWNHITPTWHILNFMLNIQWSFSAGKKSLQVNEVKQEEETILEILSHNLDPDMANKVKECWIDQNSFTTEHLLGKGDKI